MLPEKAPTRSNLHDVAAYLSPLSVQSIGDKMEFNIFYSWQSDIKSAANRSLIQSALEGAAKELRSDDSIRVEPVIDRATLNTPGARNIVDDIFKKIEKSNIFVADVTVINAGSKGRLCPNPNILIELGYAIKALTLDRIILVLNTAVAKPEDLPFDIKQNQILTYNSKPEDKARAVERRKLQSNLRDAIALILAQDDFKPKTKYPSEIEITYQKVNITQKRHDYDLKVFLKNMGTSPISEWHVDIKVPTKIIPENVTYGLQVADRSDSVQSFFRSSNKTHGAPIYPGDSKLVFALDYFIDDNIYNNRDDVFDKKIVATGYVHGELVATKEYTVRELQNF